MCLVRKVKRALPTCVVLALSASLLYFNGPKMVGSFKESIQELTNDEEETEKEVVIDDSKEEEVSLEEVFENSKNVNDAVSNIRDDLKNNYNAYIDLIASKIKDVSEKRDIVGDFAIYTTMLSNGFISYGDFEYSHTQFDILDLYGASVTVGSGVCFNEAHNMVDVFKSLGYDAKVVIGKSYLKGEDLPNGNNHAVCYVSDGDFAYLLDPTNDTILLRREFLTYYSVESQEDTIRVFKPDVTARYKEQEYPCQELITDGFNDHKKHWQVLKAYRNYKEAYEAYINEFREYEKYALLSYEEYFMDVYNLVSSRLEEEGVIKALQ